MAIEAPIKESHGWFKGEDKVLSWTIYQSDDTTIQDLTDFTIEWDLRQRDDSDVVILHKDAAIDADPATGICTVAIAASNTRDLPHGMYFYTLWRTDTGSRTVLSYGAAALCQPIPIQT